MYEQYKRNTPICIPFFLIDNVKNNYWTSYSTPEAGCNLTTIGSRPKFLASDKMLVSRRN
jgi:hypothetical protein